MGLFERIGWRATGLRNRVVDLVWEWRLGIRTRGSAEVGHPDAVRYAPFAYAAVWKTLWHMDLQSSDVFVDLGCGKGRVTCCAARLATCTIIGIDIESELCAIARDNARRLRGRRTPIQIINIAAQDFDYHRCTAIFMFNPFGAATLQQVVDIIRRSLDEYPRPLRLAYVNPRHDQVISEAGFLQRYDHWTRRPWSGLKFDVSYWRTPLRG